MTEQPTEELVRAIRAGEPATLERLLTEQPGLATARLEAHGSRTPLHIATDWPGYFPNGPEVVRVLIAAGADPNAPGPGRFPETPLHWAASSDDLEVAEALIEGGADIEAPGGSIAGTPLANAVGYGCWHVARLLVARGARIEALWQAAALGDWPGLERFLSSDPPPSQENLDSAFWQACAGGQRRIAEFLLGRGANPRAVPSYARKTALEAAAGPDTRRSLLVEWLTTLGFAAIVPDQSNQ